MIDEVDSPVAVMPAAVVGLTPLPAIQRISHGRGLPSTPVVYRVRPSAHPDPVLPDEVLGAAGTKVIPIILDVKGAAPAVGLALGV